MASVTQIAARVLEHSSAAPGAKLDKPPGLREGKPGHRCGECTHFIEGKCMRHHGYPCGPNQTCHDFEAIHKAREAEYSAGDYDRAERHAALLNRFRGKRWARYELEHPDARVKSNRGMRRHGIKEASWSERLHDLIEARRVTRTRVRDPQGIIGYVEHPSEGMSRKQHRAVLLPTSEEGREGHLGYFESPGEAAGAIKVHHRRHGGGRRYNVKQRKLTEARRRRHPEQSLTTGIVQAPTVRGHLVTVMIGDRPHYEAYSHRGGKVTRVPGPFKGRFRNKTHAEGAVAEHYLGLPPIEHSKVRARDVREAELCEAWEHNRPVHDEAGQLIGYTEEMAPAPIHGTERPYFIAHHRHRGHAYRTLGTAHTHGDAARMIHRWHKRTRRA
jgi:hypothetical protein